MPGVFHFRTILLQASWTRSRNEWPFRSTCTLRVRRFRKITKCESKDDFDRRVFEKSLTCTDYRRVMKIKNDLDRLYDTDAGLEISVTASGTDKTQSPSRLIRSKTHQLLSCLLRQNRKITAYSVGLDCSGLEIASVSVGEQFE
jgi:hypothetical protein